jgi:hypothetical protein
MCNKYFKIEYVDVDGRKLKSPVPKIWEEVESWDPRVRNDNSKDRERWRANGPWVFDDDLAELLGFGEPMMGYHGNQCFDLLELWKDICRLPVLVVLDVYLSGYRDMDQPVPEQNSALRKWLGWLRDTCAELRCTRPCASRLARGINDWVKVLVSISNDDRQMYTFKMYDHFCCVHVLPMLAREGSVIQYATFSTEHDNSVIRQDLQRTPVWGVGDMGNLGRPTCANCGIGVLSSAVMLCWGQPHGCRGGGRL